MPHIQEAENGELIKVTARRLYQLYAKKHEGILTSHKYGDLKNMELVNIRSVE